MNVPLCYNMFSWRGPPDIERKGHFWYTNYVLTHEKVSSGLQPMSIKHVQSSIQACITWSKKSRKRKGRMEKGLFGYMFITIIAKHNNEDNIYIQSGNVLTSLWI